MICGGSGLGLSAAKGCLYAPTTPSGKRAMPAAMKNAQDPDRIAWCLLDPSPKRPVLGVARTVGAPVDSNRPKSFGKLGLDATIPPVSRCFVAARGEMSRFLEVPGRPADP